MAGFFIRKIMLGSSKTLLLTIFVSLLLVLHVYNVWPLNGSSLIQVKKTAWRDSPEIHLKLSGINRKSGTKLPDKKPGGRKIYIGDNVYYDHEDDEKGVKDGESDAAERNELDKADKGEGETEKEDKNKEKDINATSETGKRLKSTKYAKLADVPNIHVKTVSCDSLFQHNLTELSLAKSHQSQHPKVAIPDVNYTQFAQNCDKFKKDRKYMLKPVNEEEESFPIAFSIVLFKDVEMVERLLRAIYRPQNYYCIHVDSKSSKVVRKAMESIAGCFDNVFLASRSVDVQWAWFSVLEPDLVCMEDLWKKYKNWKYFINLTGQEFPLKTNLDLVKILKVFNGANNMEGTIRRRNKKRTEYIHNGYYPTNVTKKEAVPHGMVLTKGSVHVTASRAFVDYVLHDKVALDFRDWVKDTGVPDETFFSSLNHNPQLKVPGAYIGDPETDQKSYPFITRFKNWGNGAFNWPCESKRVRLVCILSVGDLQLLKSRQELFANKFYLDYEPLAYDCMEELHYNRTRDEVAQRSHFNTTYYKGLSFVKSHV